MRARCPDSERSGIRCQSRWVAEGLPAEGCVEQTKSAFFRLFKSSRLRNKKRKEVAECESAIITHVAQDFCFADMSPNVFDRCPIPPCGIQKGHRIIADRFDQDLNRCPLCGKFLGWHQREPFV